MTFIYSFLNTLLILAGIYNKHIKNAFNYLIVKLGVIQKMNLETANLNLLATLNVLIKEKNVTRAAMILNLSQPALSNRLAKLRKAFNDPLLIPSPTGKGMILTKKTEEIAPFLEKALQNIEGVFMQLETFKPESAKKVFKIKATETTSVILLPHLLRRIKEESAQTKVIIIPFDAPLKKGLQEEDCDLTIASSFMIPPSYEQQKIFEDKLVLAHRKNHPRGTAPLSLSSYRSLLHVKTNAPEEKHDYIEQALKSLGEKRGISLHLSHVSMIPEVLRKSDYVATLPQKFVRAYMPDIEFFLLPFATEPLDTVMAWHPKFNFDPANIWLRNHINHISSKHIG